MQVSQRMTRDPVTVAPESTLEEALSLMLRHDVRELTVVTEGRVEGIITGRDLRSALGGARDTDDQRMDPAWLERRVEEVMSRPVRAIYPDTDMAEACRIRVDLRVGSLVVVDEQDTWLGILSVTDVLSAAARYFEPES